MEPLAPGTEDEPLYNQVSNKPTKKETAEEQALSKKAFLPNGSYGAIFELNYVQGAQHWYCRVCECPVLGKLFNHEIGKRHTANLDHWNKRSDVAPKDVAAPAETCGADAPAIVVAPGEPVPPGFEGEIEKTTMIQERLDGFNAGPLVGLEYLLELLDYDPSKEPSYLCILCDKKGDPRTVLTHLSSYNHQIMYLQKHFPTVYRHIAPFMIKQYKRNWQSGLQKIADAIENTFGRLKPMQVEAGKFEKDRMHYIEIVAKGKHFSELMGHTFENVVPKEELIKTYEETKPYDRNLPFQRQNAAALPKRKSPSPPVVPRPMKKQKQPPADLRQKHSLSPVSDISSSDLEDYDPKKPIKPQWTSRETKRERSPFSRRRGSPPPPSRKEGPMPWQKSNYGRGKLPTQSDRNRDDKTEKMDEYKKLSRAIDNDMEQVLKKHKLNPEKHPKYNDEWKKFWNMRYKELQAEGKNASTHDFKPEWIEFWNKRILELHQEEIKSKKSALRRRLGLPDEPAPISFKIGERRRIGGDQAKGPLPTAAQPDNDPEVIIIEDNDKDSVRSRSPPSLSRRKSRSPYARRGARDLSPQYRRRSPTTRRGRNASPISPPSGRSSIRKRSSERALSASSDFERISPTPLRASPPSISSRRDRYASPDRYVRLRDRSTSRGRSREISWEKERHRDYDDPSWDRSYRGGRSAAPWDSSSSSHRYVKVIDPYAPPKILRDVTREPVLEPISDDEDEVNIVAVLRLLTALEEKLGSLGPKIIELLGQALAMEKKAANSSEQLLDSEINCVLFETVKEKLKGQLLAGFVDGIKEKAFKRAIKKTASLIHMAGERKKKREVELPKKPVVVPGIGTIDKGKIARQIANALIAQGKTDVTQAELEQLINAVVGIAEAQKNSSQPLTTAAFLQKLSAGTASKDDKPPVDPAPKTTPTNPSKPDEPPSVTTPDTTKPEKTTLEDDANSQDKSIINMEGLSDSDLQTLLQNFKDLSTDEQHGLINYLKKLEAKEPERVEKLRKFVDMTDVTGTTITGTGTLDDKRDNERYSPFSNRTVSINPTSNNEKKEEKGVATTTFVQIDSEEEEYTFEDVAKAASKKVIETEMERKRLAEDAKKEADDKNLNDAKALISSLMSSLNKTNSNTGGNTGSGKVNIISNVPVSSTEIVNSLGGITMSVSSLGSILGNVQNMRQQKEELKFSPPPTSTEALNRPAPNEPTRSTRNPYNEFDIASQRDIRAKNTDFASTHQGGVSDVRPIDRTYDEFNIEPNRDESDTSRLGMNYGQYANRTPIGYPDARKQMDFRPPPPQFQQRESLMRPLGGAVNFDSRDFMRSERGGGDLYRGYDMRTGGGDYRGGPSNFRSGLLNDREGVAPRGPLPHDSNRTALPPQRYGGSFSNCGFNNNNFKRW